MVVAFVAVIAVAFDDVDDVALAIATAIVLR